MYLFIGYVKIKGDNVKYSTHCLAHSRHQVTVRDGNDDVEEKDDSWPILNCTSSVRVRPCLPRFPGI